MSGAGEETVDTNSHLEDYHFFDWLPIPTSPFIPLASNENKVEKKDVVGLIKAEKVLEKIANFVDNIYYSIRTDGIFIFRFSFNDGCDVDKPLAIKFFAAAISKFIKYIHGYDNNLFPTYFDTDESPISRSLGILPVRISLTMSDYGNHNLPDCAKKAISDGMSVAIQSNKCLSLLRGIDANGNLSRKLAILKYRENLSKKYYATRIARRVLDSEDAGKNKLKGRIIAFIILLIIVLNYFGAAYMPNKAAPDMLNKTISDLFFISSFSIFVLLFIREILIRKLRAVDPHRKLLSIFYFGNIYSAIAGNIIRFSADIAYSDPLCTCFTEKDDHSIDYGDVSFNSMIEIIRINLGMINDKYTSRAVLFGVCYVFSLIPYFFKLFSP